MHHYLYKEQPELASGNRIAFVFNWVLSCHITKKICWGDVDSEKWGSTRRPETFVTPHGLLWQRVNFLCQLQWAGEWTWQAWLYVFVSLCVRGKSSGIHFSSTGGGDTKITGEFAISTENVSVKDALFAQWQLHVSPCEASQCSISTRRSGDQSRVPCIRYKDPEYMNLCINNYWLQKNKNLRKVFINLSHIGSITSVHSQPCESRSLLQVPGVPPHSQFSCLPKIPPPLSSPTHSIGRTLFRQVYSQMSYRYQVLHCCGLIAGHMFTLSYVYSFRKQLKMTPSTCKVLTPKTILKDRQG